ncbi:MAG: DUF1592 domain-containing protein [Deltaproteobacteria bacterium]|nr:DUF1592 domain-containing protein [Deltaproteobacteria bacterium]
MGTMQTWRRCAWGLTLLALAGCYDGAPARADHGDGDAGDMTAGTAEGEGGGSSGDAGESGGAPIEFVPGALVLPRLTALQYRHTLVDLLGEPLPPTPVEPDTNPYLFYAIGATSTTLSELGTQQYEEAADAVTHAVFDDPTRRAAFMGCEPVAPGDGCVAQFLASFGRRAFRRPLTDDEHARWLQVAVDLAEPDAIEGARSMVAGMLQSPWFLYRVEIGKPDAATPERLRYDGWEMASRLSYLLWNTMPDDALFAAAERGDLDTTDGIRSEVERMLADERAHDAIGEFFAQFLDLGRLDGVMRDPAVYPSFSLTMPDSMRTEVELLVADAVFREQGDIRRIFSTRRTFVNSELAALYELDVSGATPITFVPVELPEDGPRAGLLTLGAFLTMNAKQTQTSPTARGKYVRERVLCQTVPPPPANVNTQLDPPSGEGETLREILEEHRKNPACTTCHTFIDPPGLLFENFDSVGAHRELENGVPVDSSGELDGTPLADGRELAALLESRPEVSRCIVQQLFRAAQGRLDTDDEEAVIDDLDRRFGEADHRFLDLVQELVVHDGFRTASPQGGV